MGQLSDGMEGCNFFEGLKVLDSFVKGPWTRSCGSLQGIIVYTLFWRARGAKTTPLHTSVQPPA